MENKNEKKDYTIRLDKARKKRSKNDYKRYFILGGGAILCVAVISAAGMWIKNHLPAKPAGLATGSEAIVQMTEKSSDLKAEAESESAAQAAKEQAEKETVVNSYKNLGIIQVSGYLNVRKAPGTEEDVVGKLQGDSACDIFEKTETGWYKISSGGIEGYINTEYVLTGEDAKIKAMDLVKLRAVVQTDNMNI